MEMRKTNVWVSRSLGLLFVFSSFGHFAEANSSKSQVVQGGTTSRMATIGRFCKKHWYLAIPAMGAAGYVAYRFRNKSTEQKNESNSVVRKPEQQGAAQEEQQQPANSSVDEQEKTQPENLIAFEDDAAKPSEPTESLTSDNDNAWGKWKNIQRKATATMENLRNIATMENLKSIATMENVVKVVAGGIAFKLVCLAVRKELAFYEAGFNEGYRQRQRDEAPAAE